MIATGGGGVVAPHGAGAASAPAPPPEPPCPRELESFAQLACPRGTSIVVTCPPQFELIPYNGTALVKGGVHAACQGSTGEWWSERYGAWYPNGVQAASADASTWTTSYENAVVAAIVHFDRHGELHGALTRWHPDGVKALEATCRHGEVVGHVRAWDDRGHRIDDNSRDSGRCGYLLR